MSFVYSAHRERRLEDRERARIAEIVAAFSVRAQIDDFHRTGYGWNGEDFEAVLADPPQPLISGCIQLPSTQQSMLVGPDAELYNAILHWSEAITQVRRAVEGATWEVSVSGQKIAWNARTSMFVPPVPDDAVARRTHRSRWERALVGASDERLRHYAAGATYAVGDLLVHSAFGRGIVERLVDKTKVEILFREGLRVLAHDVPGAPAKPTAPKELDLDDFPSGDDPF